MVPVILKSKQLGGKGRRTKLSYSNIKILRPAWDSWDSDSTTIAYFIILFYMGVHLHTGRHLHKHAHVHPLTHTKHSWLLMCGHLRDTVCKLATYHKPLWEILHTQTCLIIFLKIWLIWYLAHRVTSLAIELCDHKSNINVQWTRCNFNFPQFTSDPVSMTEIILDHVNKC